MGGLLLSNKFPRIKFNQHGPISLKLLHRNRKSKVVKKEELQLQVVEFGQRKAPNLSPQSAKTLFRHELDPHTLAYLEFV